MRVVRSEFRSARMDLDEAGTEARRAAAAVRNASDDVMAAGRAGLEAARHVAGAATERLGETAADAAEAVRDRVGEVAGEVAMRAGRKAVGLGAQIVNLPEVVRERARRGVELVESASARAVVSVIHASTKALSAAAEYVEELAPRRRIDRRALQELLIEQLRWAHAGTEAYDQAVNETDDIQVRMQLVRFKLQTIKHAESLTKLLHAIGGTVPTEERSSPPPTVEPANGAGARGPASSRQGLAHALTIATQSAEGWRALGQIAVWAEPERLADAIERATDAVGTEPAGQVEFLRSALLETTVAAVLP